MIAFAVCGLLAALMSSGVECGYTSSGSSSSSASDGSGHTFTQSNNNGQGTYQHTQTKPGGFVNQQTGSFPASPGYYGPANFGQPGFGFNYGPAYGYGPFSNTPAYNPIPQAGFPGFNAPFQPFQQFQPFPQFQPLATPQEFNDFLSGLQAQYSAGGTFAKSSEGATAFASSYLGPNKYYKQQQDLLSAWKNPPYQTAYGGNPNYAYATGSYGPNGYQQSAGVYPQNPNTPNLNTRFDATDNNGAAKPFFNSIQTSSFSHSSDVNGIKKHKEGAATTINDNGKVTTYKVEN